MQCLLMSEEKSNDTLKCVNVAIWLETFSCLKNRISQKDTVSDTRWAEFIDVQDVKFSLRRSRGHSRSLPGMSHMCALSVTAAALTARWGSPELIDSSALGVTSFSQRGWCPTGLHGVCWQQKGLEHLWALAQSCISWYCFQKEPKFLSGHAFAVQDSV